VDGVVPFEPLARFLGEAGDAGYNYVGVSGGEPFLWKDLDRFLDFAAEKNYTTSITTNGTLIDRRRAAGLRGRVGLVAVSVDGPPEEHARVRASSKAFQSMRSGLEALAGEGVRFAVAFTLTRYNADQLSWLMEFASEVGASGVNVHPLCDFGAARENLKDSTPDSIEFRAAGWLLALIVHENAGKGPAVTLDAIERRVVEQSCWPMIKGERDQILATRFPDLVPSMVLETDGTVVPFIYGFPRSWAVGAIGDRPFADLAAEWRGKCAVPVSGMLRSTLKQLASCGEEYIDLFGQLLATAHREDGAGMVAIPQAGGDRVAGQASA
jgi:MoaA/NifB/PqqE/SkfB family radical SAM enzyme